MSDALKGLKYAEDSLGVNSVYNEAQRSRLNLTSTLAALATARDRKRDLEFRLHDAEMEVAANEYGKHPDMAQTRMDKHLKQALSQDDNWRELREQLSKASYEIDDLDYERVNIETDIKIAVSRMVELGGYLNYLAELKRAANSTKPTE